MIDFEGWHTCHFCGTYVDVNGYEHGGKRHFLSDCRSDLVEHEIGDLCTWAFRRKPEFKRLGEETEDFPENRTCYAYQDRQQNWTDDHIHFYKDGPM